jgi:hypothetical protein
MTPEKLISVFQFYHEELGRKGIEGKQLEKYNALTADLTEAEILGHIDYMCVEAVQLVKDRRLKKAFRWLGFVQGTLWAKGIYPVDELKEHSRPLGPNECPHCHTIDGSCMEVRNYNIYFSDGDVYCKTTDKYVRNFDAG